MTLKQRGLHLVAVVAFGALLIKPAFAVIDEAQPSMIGNIGAVTVLDAQEFSRTPAIEMSNLFDKEKKSNSDELLFQVNTSDFSDLSNKEMDELRAGAYMTQAYINMILSGEQRAEQARAMVQARAQAIAANQQALRALGATGTQLFAVYSNSAQMGYVPPAYVPYLKVIPRGNPNFVYRNSRW